MNIQLFLRKTSLHFLLYLVLACLCPHASDGQVSYRPINRNASPEAKNLLSFLYSIQGKYILSGQHNYPHELTRSSDSTYAITGKSPSVWGSDFIDPKFRQQVVNEAIRQYRNGAIVTLMDHMVKPFEPGRLGFAKGVKGRVTDEQWKEVITPGTKYNRALERKMDTIAYYLLQLKKPMCRYCGALFMK